MCSTMSNYKFSFYLFLLLSVTLMAQASIDVVAVDKTRVLKLAKKYLNDKPLTITSFHAERSAGGVHDYYSESDYWWPDPKDPNGPYIQQDGQTNPTNFNVHREALRDFSMKVPALTAAYKITKDKKFAIAAIKHLNAWFADTATMMNPSLLYSQAIRNKVTGRGIGVIDTIHLIELTKAIEVLEQGGALSHKDADRLRDWFRKYLTWLTTHKYGLEERDQKNNHGSWWNVQVAAFAKFTGNDSLLNYARDRFTNTIFPTQMAADGSFPLELKRTKPYNYSLFNLEAYLLMCQFLSDAKHNVWEFQLADGRSIKKAMEFMYPFIKDKKSWNRPPDLMYYECYPIRQVGILFAGLNLHEQKYLDLWKELKPDFSSEEIVRTFALRQPILWVD